MIARNDTGVRMAERVVPTARKQRAVRRHSVAAAPIASATTQCIRSATTGVPSQSRSVLSRAGPRWAAGTASTISRTIAAMILQQAIGLGLIVACFSFMTLWK